MDNRTNCLNVGSSLPRWTVRERGIVFRNVFLNVAGKKKGCRRRSPTLPLAASGQTNFSHPFADGTSTLGMRVRDSPEIGSQSHIQITAAPALTFLSLSDCRRRPIRSGKLRAEKTLSSETRYESGRPLDGRGRDVGRSLDLHTDAKKGGRGRRDACGEGGDENGCNNGWRFICTGQHYKNLPSIQGLE